MTTNIGDDLVLTARRAGEPQPEPEPEGAVMSLVEHLSELRIRIVKVVLAIAAGSVVGLYFNREIRDFLLLPLPTHTVQVLNPGDAFSITVRIALITGVIVAMPIILYQLWAFVAPGLTPSERRAILPWIPVSLVFFAIGVGLAWLVLPVAVGFLLSFTDASLRADLAAGPYFDFVGMLFLGFGLAMQYPILLFALARIGIVSSAKLRAWRRYVILVIVIVGTAIMPPDAFSDIAMSIVLYVLYELTIFAVARTGR